MSTRVMNLTRSAAVSEWGALFSAVRGRLMERRLAAIPFTVLATLLVLLFGVLQHLPGGAALAARLGVVCAAQPFALSLLRTPLSLFVPALDLPVWGAMLQVLVVFGIAELALGLRRTLVVGYACTLAGTLFTRIGVSHDSGLPAHLPAWFAHVRDTGPSAAVVGLALCAAWRYGAWYTGAGVIAVMSVEAILLPNLAGLEHLAALTCAALIVGLSAAARRFFPSVSPVKTAGAL
ncbi:hypothetical protein P3T36_005700 [Kitasatospora sp. MAP12-15]|uniref:hypothetical protein n=1 Tax=unclassified Kitasatospora TaxID=2633591 RepID=UPI002474454D|nr:hypothetical protein [Kitasatospora sp. MAP12-44]MDH6113788.1 hypothetical protein [Kitasatospora sp. MAP12-44]